MKQYIIILAVAILNFIPAKELAAQNPMAILQEIQAKHTAQTQQCYLVQIDYYDQSDTKEENYTAEMYIVQTPQQTYSRIKSGTERLEQFVENDLAIEVDHLHKTIHYYSQNKEATTRLGFDQFIALSQLEGMTLSAVSSSGYTGLRLSAPEHSGTVMELYYDDNYRVVKTSIQVAVDNGQYQGQWNNTKVVCQFSYPEKIESHSINDFIQRSGGKTTPAKAFSDYQIIR